jgi:outer membrane protein assembly factor BamB
MVMRRTRLVLTAVVAAAVLAWAGPAAAAPVVTVTPGIATPSQTLTIGASGFGATEGVDIFLDTTDLALAITDGGGNLASVQVALPATVTPGNHWITLLGRRDGVGAQKLLTVHTPYVQQGWSGFHRGLNPFENVLNPGNVSGLQEDWTDTFAGSVTFGGPAVAAGARQVIYGDSPGTVRSVSQLTGAVSWAQALGGAVESTPAIDSGRVYVHAFDGKVHALNSTTGAILWQTTIGAAGDAYSSPTVVANVVYVGSNDDNVYALNGSTGAVIWKGSTGGEIFGSPAVSGGRVFVGSLNGAINAFAVGCSSGGSTCGSLWTDSTANAVPSSPAVANGVVYIASSGKVLFALNAGTGGVLWSGTLPSVPDVNSPAVANGLVYIGATSGVLTAFPAACGSGGATCSPRWQSPALGNEIDSSPAIANGVVYMTAIDFSGTGLVMGFPATCSTPCSPLWTASQPGYDVTRPVVSDGMVFAGDLDGNLTAWDLPAATHVHVRRPDPRTLEPDLTLEPVD